MNKTPLILIIKTSPFFKGRCPQDRRVFISYNTSMKKIINFLKEVAVEFKNITWPKKDTLIQLTIVVISISIIISLILGGFDNRDRYYHNRKLN